jgi:hypothetical protein
MACHLMLLKWIQVIKQGTATGCSCSYQSPVSPAPWLCAESYEEWGSMGEQLPINQTFRFWTLSASWSGVRATPLDSGQLETCDFGRWITLYHVAVRLEGLDVANAWRTIPTSMCGANCEILRTWNYSVEVFFVEWTWPSRNTVWKSKRGRIQGHFDPLHTVCGRRPVRWRQLSVLAWQCSLP